MSANWMELANSHFTDTLFDAPWTCALESFGYADHLRIRAEGEWPAIPGTSARCGPNGFPGLVLADNTLILTTCRAGALIGKFGGSSANVDPVPNAEGAAASANAFAIGSFCIMPVPANLRGPFFIGFNLRGQAIIVKSLKLVIDGACFGPAAPP
jgi:hypothetical protein